MFSPSPLNQTDYSYIHTYNLAPESVKNTHIMKSYFVFAQQEHFQYSHVKIPNKCCTQIVIYVSHPARSHVSSRMTFASFRFRWVYRDIFSLVLLYFHYTIRFVREKRRPLRLPTASVNRKSNGVNVCWCCARRRVYDFVFLSPSCCWFF